MHIYKYLYVPEGLQKKKENLIKKLKNGKLLPGVYLITLASTDQNQLDIFPACIRRQKNYPEELPLVVGLTKDFEDALDPFLYFRKRTGRLRCYIYCC